MSKSRKGSSLVEMLISMMILSVVAGMAVTTIVLLMRSQTRVSRQLFETAVLARFADEFRQDVHAAKSVKIDDQQTNARLNIVREDGSTVTYSSDGPELLKSVANNQQTTRRETFRLQATQFSFAIGDEGKLVAATLSQPYTEHDEPTLVARRCRIEAIVGSSARHNRSKED